MCICMLLSQQQQREDSGTVGVHGHQVRGFLTPVSAVMQNAMHVCPCILFFWWRGCGWLKHKQYWEEQAWRINCCEVPLGSCNRAQSQGSVGGSV